MTKLDMFITDKVRELREKLGFTPNDIGSILDVSSSFINSIEAKKTHEKYNIEHLSKIAFLFGCKISDLLPENVEEFFEKDELRVLKIDKDKIITDLENKITKRR
ncbi:MAG: helix-turn-helix transcriptional regulator [Candidatus Delongbacteria bacterium]